MCTSQGMRVFAHMHVDGVFFEWHEIQSVNIIAWLSGEAATFL